MYIFLVYIYMLSSKSPWGLLSGVSEFFINQNQLYVLILFFELKKIIVCTYFFVVFVFC